LLNNAAMINANAPLWEVSDSEFSQLVDINIKGVASMIRHFVPTMIQKGSGVVVNFSSYWGRSTSPEVAPYCASKWAMEGLSQSLAQELPDGLASIALNPGIINTDMLQSCFGEGASAYPTAQQWAINAVPFLANLNASDNGHSLTAP
jgi:NAD(P)-dependent dehydrogenase (short-subunit alcohol dehydrogenase family)